MKYLLFFMYKRVNSSVYLNMLENYVFPQFQIHTIISSWLVHPHILLTVCVAIIDCPLLEQVDEHMRGVFLTPPYS